jgi:hypothetical protein
MSVMRHCRVAVSARTGIPFKIVDNEWEANSLRTAGWLVVEYAPTDNTPGAAEALRRIAAGHAHPSKLAGEALDALPPDDNVYDPPYIERGQ